jgi:hypothetical protein
VDRQSPEAEASRKTQAMPNTSKILDIAAAKTGYDLPTQEVKHHVSGCLSRYNLATTAFNNRPITLTNHQRIDTIPALIMLGFEEI